MCSDAWDAYMCASLAPPFTVQLAYMRDILSCHPALFRSISTYLFWRIFYFQQFNVILNVYFHSHGVAMCDCIPCAACTQYFHPSFYHDLVHALSLSLFLIWLLIHCEPFCYRRTIGLRLANQFIYSCCISPLFNIGPLLFVPCRISSPNAPNRIHYTPHLAHQYGECSRSTRMPLHFQHN